MHIHSVTLRPETYPVKDVYPFNLGVFSRAQTLALDTPVTFFAGENGTGKTTLLRAVARNCSIHIWKDDTRSTVHYNKYEDQLCRCIDVGWTGERVPGSFFASEIFQYFAQSLDEWAVNDPGMFRYFGGGSLLTRSHGQRHLAYFNSRYRIKGVYFLDEPENALSPKKQIELLGILRQTAAGGVAQFVIATHSPILLAYPGARIYSFDSVPIAEVRYEETEYYRIYKDFLQDRSKYLDGVFNEN